MTIDELEAIVTKAAQPLQAVNQELSAEEVTFGFVIVAYDGDPEGDEPAMLVSNAADIAAIIRLVGRGIQATQRDDARVGDLTDIGKVNH